MALDGVFLRHIKNEIETELEGARIDKIHQPAQDQLIISLRQKGGAKKLLISVSANMPRIHFTESNAENPKSPPMFCMLLRKYLLGAKLLQVTQYELDRIITLIFETRNELGDLVQIKLITEIMGRHSNIILVGDDGKIIDSIKRVDPSMSSVRQVLSGMRYELPPLQDKFNLLTSSVDDVIIRLKNGGDYPLSKSLMNCISGISPLIAREISFNATNSLDTTANYLSENELEKLKALIAKLKETIINYSGTPVIVYDNKKAPCEFSFMNITVLGSDTYNKTLLSFSAVLDSYFAEKDLICRMRAKGSDLIRLITSLIDRTKRKIETQKKELEETKNRDIYRIYGDILNANLYLLNKGDAGADLVNFYSPEQEKIHIKLNPRLTPSQNAQKYYQEYKKLTTAEKKLTEFLKEGEEELLYLDSVMDILSRCTLESELNALREELYSVGYIKKSSHKNQKQTKPQFKRYVSSDGFLILVGKNNLENDQLTLKIAKSDDVWFHTKDIPGSHTVVVSEGKIVPEKTLEEAAIIAATHSKAADDAHLIAVDYTIAKNVKKPNGAKPGRVIYNYYNTAYVDPNKELCSSLEENK